MSPLDHFVRPEFARLLVVVPIAGFLLIALDRLRRRRVSQAIGPRAHLLAGSLSRGRRRVRRILFLAAIVLIVIAAMQPRWGEGAGTVAPRATDLVICLDVSRSMLARDVSPSRLVRAKREIRTLLGRAEGDRFGLVVFAGEARVLVPLTRDRRSFLELAEQADPLIVGKGGTDLGAALLTALGACSDRAEGREAIVLLTDGDDLEGRGLSVAKTCRERGIPVHTFGLGSPRGARIPVMEAGRETYLRDGEGREVVSAMDEESLRRIAAETGGAFATTDGGEGALVQIYENEIRPTARRTFLAEERQERENRYQWPLLLAFLLLMADFLLCEKRR